MAWPEKKFFSEGGVQKMRNFFSHFWVLFDVDFAMKAKKTGVRIPVWRYGPSKNSVQEGWKLCFAVFSVFFFSAQGCTHTHHRPRIGAKPTSNMIFGGYGQHGPTNRPKLQGGLPPGQRQRAAPLGTGLRRLPKWAPLRSH